MGKSNSVKKKTNKKAVDKVSKKKKNNLGAKDPLGVRVVFNLFILFMVLTFAVGGLTVFVTTSSISNDGVLTFMNYSFVELSNFDTSTAKASGAIVDANHSLASGNKVAFRHTSSDGKWTICDGIFEKKNGANYEVKIFRGSTPEKIVVKASEFVGVITTPIDSPILMAFVTNPLTFLLVFAAFIAITLVFGLLHFLVSPRGAKQFEKNEETVTKKTVVEASSENSELLTHYLSTDDNIQPIDPGENQTGPLLNINYYNSVRLHNGEVYAVVKKYQETARRLKEYGASDMDIIRMNMIGNTEFEQLILSTHKEKTMTLWEIIDFAHTLEGVYCVKKRGTLNWTYKYKSKTLFIIKRDSDDSDGYKVSIKVYPDAATKLNIIYKALEDSSFPIGPYWYMFNDLRNLPANVIKWLMQESLNISKWQQVKADLLRDTPTLASFKLDTEYMRDMVLAGTKQFDLGKFAIITQNDTEETAKYDTVLKTGFGSLDMEDFTKEISMAVPELRNVQMSILTRKSASEALVNALCNELLDVNAAADNQPEQPNNLNNIVSASATKVVKKSDKKRR